MVPWLAANWVAVLIPLLSFGATVAVGIWLRSLIVRSLENRASAEEWEGRVSRLIVRAARRPFLFWFVLLGGFIADEASVLPVDAKVIAGKVLSSVLVLSLAWAAIAISEELLELYMSGIKVARTTVDLIFSLIIIAFLAGSILIALDIWGVPTTPFLIIIAVGLLLLLLALRNFAPNVVAALHMWNTEHVKEGDYIKLETGEEGYVTEINWNSTHIKTLQETMVAIPNSRLIQTKFINIGQPEKVTRELFTFNGRAIPPEFPELKAAELAAVSHPDETRSVLSEREREIAKLISEGVSNREIGQRLFIAENTVKVHVKNILKKLELKNRQQLAAYTALQNWTAMGEGRSDLKIR